MEGSKLFRKDWEGKEAGGVDLYVSEYLDSLEPDGGDERVECLLITIKGKANSVTPKAIQQEMVKPCPSCHQADGANQLDGGEWKQVPNRRGKSIPSRPPSPTMVPLKNRSMGPDGIHPRVMRGLAEELTKPLSIIYQQFWLTGDVPHYWKLVNVTFIHKKGYKDDPANNRPVSLTSVLRKVVEQIILSAITQHLQDG
ncbi:hypothetical protein BTVI_106267 [Pitangus sulphuratus]|nr:hypothetical protein BTVI_106267 [Pitangus sulphuratus]